MGGLPVKPKLQGYVAQELFDEFEAYRVSHNLNQSKALEKLLAEYFGTASAPSLPTEDVIAVAALRAELAALRVELLQRLEFVESRLASESALPLDESATVVNRLVTISVTESAYAEATTPVDDLAESAANLVDESAVVVDAIAVPVNVSATSSADESAASLAESVASSADESVVEEAIAVPTELISATKLAPLLNVTQPTVSRAAKNGNEFFRKWSSEHTKSAGVTWDFLLVQKGKKQEPQYFQVIDTASV